MATLSGPEWVEKFPTSTQVCDLKDPFKGSVENFLAALKKAGATVAVSATFRPPERAYLMHYSFRIAKKGDDPSQVPAKKGVDIDWVHRNAKGEIDLHASKHAARQMVSKYKIVFQPALKSRHTEGKALDMDISWGGDLTIDTADGKSTTIQSLPRTGSNAELQAVGLAMGYTSLRQILHTGLPTVTKAGEFGRAI